MIYEAVFQKFGKRSPVRLGLIGSGHYGTAVLTQSMHIPQLDVPAIADYSVDAAKLAFARAGVSAEDIRVCDSRSAALAALEAGKRIIVQDAMLLMNLPLDVISESTGVAEAGAVHAAAAIRSGKHVAMITKDTDSAVGPVLKKMADDNGVVYAPVDGDQHGLLTGLVTWARSLGLEVLAAGKSRDGEFVYDRAAGTLTLESDKRTVHETQVVTLTNEQKRWFERIPAGEAASYARERRALLAPYAVSGAYDLCESVIMANTLGLSPDRPELHDPIARKIEIAEALSPASSGGLLSSAAGYVDIVTSLREKDETGMGGGVFIVVNCVNDYSRYILTTKGLHVNSKGDASLIYRPYHLCGVETAMTIMCAGLLGVSTGSAEYAPRYDLIKTAARDMKAGEKLGNDHDATLKGSIAPAAAVQPEAALPAHLITGNRLKRDIPAGTVITAELVEEPADSVIWALRREQDRVFLAAGAQ